MKIWLDKCDSNSSTFGLAGSLHVNQRRGRSGENNLAPQTGLELGAFWLTVLVVFSEPDTQARKVLLLLCLGLSVCSGRTTMGPARSLRQIRALRVRTKCWRGGRCAWCLFRTGVIMGLVSREDCLYDWRMAIPPNCPTRGSECVVVKAARLRR